MVSSRGRSLSRASRALTTGIGELGPSARLRSEDTLPAEMLGMMHLVQAQHAARDKQHDDAQAHLAEAKRTALQRQPEPFQWRFILDRSWWLALLPARPITAHTTP